MKPVRLQRSRRKGARLVSPNGLLIVCVTRPGKWGNPYDTAAEFGRMLNLAIYAERHQASFPFTGDAVAFNRMKVIARHIGELRNQNLACWCKLCDRHRKTGKPLDEHCPDCKPCHCDLLGEIANSQGGAS